MVLAFQNCSKVGFQPDSMAAFKSGGDGRNQGDDGLLGGADGQAPGDDGAMPGGREDGEDGANGDCDDGDDSETPKVGDMDPSEDMQDDEDWMYIPGGRGHVPMSSVAICPAGTEDAGEQECPMFCYKGVDYIMHRSEARNYFAEKFDEQPNYGGGAVPGTCANPDLKIKN